MAPGGSPTEEPLCKHSHQDLRLSASCSLPAWHSPEGMNVAHNSHVHGFPSPSTGR
jgi:hypothetical protein